MRSNVDVQKYKDWFDKTYVTNKDLPVAISSFQKNSKQVLDDRLNTEFGMSSDELIGMVTADIKNILEQYDVNSDEFNIEDIRVYGSYATGKNKDTSDLDFIVQYSGSMREDDAFNMLHDEGLEITDKNGVVRTIDINPINRTKSGTIDEHIGTSFYQSDIKIKPINIEKDSVPNFENISELKNWISENLNLIGDIEIKSNNRIVQFSKSSISRSMKGVNRNNAKRNSFAGLRELVQNAFYSYPKDVDERHSSRNKGQEVYHNAFVYDGKIYGIEISVDIPKSVNSVNTYAGHKIKVLGITEVSSNEGLLDSTSTTISITDIQKLFNPNVTEHEEVVIDWSNPQKSRISNSTYYSQTYRQLDYDIRITDHNRALKGSGQWSDDAYKTITLNGIDVKIGNDFFEGDQTFDVVLNKMSDFKKVKQELTNYIKDSVKNVYWNEWHKDMPKTYFQSNNTDTSEQELLSRVIF